MKYIDERIPRLLIVNNDSYYSLHTVCRDCVFLNSCIKEKLQYERDIANIKNSLPFFVPRHHTCELANDFEKYMLDNKINTTFDTKNEKYKKYFILT